MAEKHQRKKKKIFKWSSITKYLNIYIHTKHTHTHTAMNRYNFQQAF